MKEVTAIRDETSRLWRGFRSMVRGRAREAIEATIEEELTELLSSGPYERAEGGEATEMAARGVR